ANRRGCGHRRSSRPSAPSGGCRAPRATARARPAPALGRPRSRTAREDAFPSNAVNGLDPADHTQLQFPSTDLTLRGYPFNAERNIEQQATLLGAVTAVPGFRQLANPLRWDYALKAADQGTVTGVGINQITALPNALKSGATVR